MEFARDLLERFGAGFAGEVPVPRVAVVVAHPDDEALGVGSLLPALAPGLRVIHTTDGSPPDPSDAHAAGFATREAYAQARREELHEALALAGVGPEQALCLSFGDQQASLDLAGLSRALLEALADFRPQVVVSHAYEGGHPDHDASAFAVHAAVHLLEAAGRGPAPAIVEMPLYRARPGGGFVFGEFLPDPGREEVTRHVTEDQRALKAQMIACFRSQARTLAGVTIGDESFRLAPRYDFTRPPHEGPLGYERFPWGMTGDRFRRLAAEALADLAAGGGVP